MGGVRIWARDVVLALAAGVAGAGAAMAASSFSLPSPAADEMSRPTKPTAGRGPQKRSLSDALLSVRSDFERQERDPEWAQAAEGAIRDSTSAPDFAGASLREFECRAYLCRAVIHFDTPTARDGFHRVINLEPWTHGGLIHPIESSPDRVEVFVVRQGFALPLKGGRE